MARNRVVPAVSERQEPIEQTFEILSDRDLVPVSPVPRRVHRCFLCGHLLPDGDGQAVEDHVTEVHGVGERQYTKVATLLSYQAAGRLALVDGKPPPAAKEEVGGGETAKEEEHAEVIRQSG